MRTHGPFPCSILDTLEAAWLRRVFMRALGATVASTLGAAACTDSEAGDCDEARVVDLAAVRPAQPFDFAALRVTTYSGGPSALPDWAHAGAPCSGATDVDACLAAVGEPLLMDQAQPSAAALGCGMVGCTYLVTTRGDEVDHYFTRSEILEFLGPIDSLEDVRLLLKGGYQSECNNTRIEPQGSGFRVTTQRVTDSCPAMFTRAVVQVARDGEVVEVDSEPMSPPSGPLICAGRRPQGLASTAHAARALSLGAHFAAMSALEDASVTAFEVLARELAQHGAPSTLIEAALAAACDEVRHADATAAIARKYGVEAASPRIPKLPLRCLEDIALDNATEGCVRETFGALLGHYQASMARDPQIAAAMRQIAEDETRHAALSQRIDAWIMGRLDSAARARVNAARAEAVAGLLDAAASNPGSMELHALAGVPDAAATTRLVASLTRELWS